MSTSSSQVFKRNKQNRKYQEIHKHTKPKPNAKILQITFAHIVRYTESQFPFPSFFLDDDSDDRDSEKKLYDGIDLGSNNLDLMVTGW